MSTEKLRVRILNGYRAIYLPDHPKAMTSDNWKGFIYEHIAVAEQKIGRTLTDEEVVHHLDNNPLNNKYENLMVLTRSEHFQLHRWIDKIKPDIKNNEYYHDRQSTIESKEPDYCKVCNNILQTGQDKFCSTECMYKQRALDAEVNRGGKSKPTKEQLQEDMKTLPWIHIGAKYGVSNNAAKKWAIAYGLETKKERIVTKTNPSPNKIYKSLEEKMKAKLERQKLRYANMTPEEKQKRRGRFNIQSTDLNLVES